MDDAQLIQMAKERGFTGAGVLDSTDLVFDESFRKYCEDNRCGNFGANYSCPPDCGTTEEMAEKTGKYKKVLVFQRVYDVEDWEDKGYITSIRTKHNRESREFLMELEEHKITGIPMLAGHCDLCTPCARISGEDCRFPEQISSCLSAYCINVEKMADACGLLYWGNGNQLAYFSVLLYNPED